MAALLSDMLLMPSPRDKGTLHFKGRDIDMFLSKFEYYADHAHLTEIQRCDFICLYFSKKERRVLDILEGYQCRKWDQLKEELWSLYSSSCTSGSISPYAEPEYDQEARYEFAGHEADGSQALKSQLYATSELRSLAGLFDICRESLSLYFGFSKTKIFYFFSVFLFCLHMQHRDMKISH